jgi:signal transduction histidine kinase
MEKISQEPLTLEEFFRIAAHDLRNPLSVILNYSELLAGQGLSERPARQVAALWNAADRMRRMIDNLETLTSLQAGRLQLSRAELELGTIVDLIAEKLSSQAEQRGTRIRLDVASDAPAAVADRDRSIQIIGALVDNAIRHSPSDSDIEVSVRKKKNGVAVSVTDHGPGIPEDRLARLFDCNLLPVPNRQKGLSLHVAKLLAEAQGGELTVTCRPGEGTVFTVVFPQKASAPRVDRAVEALISEQRPL